MPCRVRRSPTISDFGGVRRCPQTSGAFGLVLGGRHTFISGSYFRYFAPLPLVPTAMARAEALHARVEATQVIVGGEEGISSVTLKEASRASSSAILDGVSGFGERFTGGCLS